MDLAGYLQFVAALALVLALIGGVAWLVRRSGMAGTLAPGALRKGSGRRLGVLEVLPLDGRRKLVLLRCDAQEHLLLLNQGPSPDLVVSSTAIPTEPADFATELEQKR